jgi:hypothetical protein
MLIIKFGMSLLKKLGPKRANDIAQRLRLLARLSLRLSMILQQESPCDLKQFISGSGFNKIIEAIEAECAAFYDEHGRRLFRNPDLALKLGHSLLKLAKLKLGESTRSCDATAKSEAEAFISLHASDYTDFIAAPAHASTKIMPKRLVEFPDSGDLTRLKTYQQQMSDQLCKELECQPDSCKWRALAEKTMTRVIVFNARRGSEVSELLVSEYNAKTNHVQQSVLDSMSEVERKQLNRYYFMVSNVRFSTKSS